MYFIPVRVILRAAKLNPCTVDMSRKLSKDIPLIESENLIADIPDDVKIVCVELAENAIALPDYHHPHNAIYVFGPEDGTINQNIIDTADSVVYVPTFGCMNLAATVNVVLYDRLAKSALNFSDNAENNKLIRESRDINNRLTVCN